MTVIRKRLSHSYYDITRIKEDREKLRNFLFMTGAFIDPENFEEKVPKVVKEFEEKNVAQDENNNAEEESEDNHKESQKNFLVMLEKFSAKFDRNKVDKDLRENILWELDKVRGKFKNDGDEESDDEESDDEEYDISNICKLSFFSCWKKRTKPY